jgi:hypothetical protein
VNAGIVLNLAKTPSVSFPIHYSVDAIQYDDTSLSKPQINKCVREENGRKIVYYLAVT